MKTALILPHFYTSLKIHSSTMVLVIVSLGYSQQWIAFTKEASINSQEVRDLNANTTGRIRPVDVELNTNRISDSSHPFQSASFSSFSR